MNEIEFTISALGLNLAESEKNTFVFTARWT